MQKNNLSFLVIEKKVHIGFNFFDLDREPRICEHKKLPRWRFLETNKFFQKFRQKNWFFKILLQHEKNLILK